MSESHLQVNDKGEVVSRKTVLIPNTFDKKREVIISLFNQTGWTVDKCENVSGSNWHINVHSESIDQGYKIDLFIGSIRDEDRKPDEFKMQLGSTYPSGQQKGYLQLILGIYTSTNECAIDDLILAAYSPNGYDFSTNPSIRGTRTSGLQVAKIRGLNWISETCVIFRPDFLYYILEKVKNGDLFKLQGTVLKLNCSESGISTSYLTAMRTKPFLLLAGISGTGKSRIVKQMAFESCPDIPALRSDKTAPGNYELIEVKPNWHDSSELLGYESEIGGPHYVVTPFVRFLVKAMRYPDVPFFVCMDEMNLAPVEQYFAEFLSVLESRKLLSDGTITSEPLIKADIFSKYADQLHRDLGITDTETYKAVYDRLKNDGLRLPSNLIVVGTVNMDETTHQFSRKVIDRAMTIEMNIEDAETPFKNFFEGGDALHYYDNPQPKDLFLPKVVQASEALSILSAEDAAYLKENVPGLLHSLNSALNGTPFKIAYRVQNELILYFFSLREENPDEAAEALLAQAMDAILMMKVLPRIEGDEDLLDKPLKALAQFTENYPQASRKIAEMQERLPQAHFTCFWP